MNNEFKKNSIDLKYKSLFNNTVPIKIWGQYLVFFCKLILLFNKDVIN